ncbi:hypothetical protein R75461_01156 [Paraburkholderia nemoris]|uniref:hypothetical protein n=1 Tax=Paraburkholderia nemoris TaxID=2793076 RepID=UPI001AFDA4FA|nr:hypothetical protein [Paraburkholderia nemoris]CAE6713190.1 hypothetical protein R75461_01156 [Paraburkholderia nemoris]
MTETTKRDIRYVTIEPGRISLHGIALTDGEYAVLRGIAERMKVRHWSDCATHNEPAYRNGPCDCEESAPC